MQPGSRTAISSLGRKAEEFYDRYRRRGLDAVRNAAAEHGDVIDAYVTQNADYVSQSWTSKFDDKDARRACFALAALIAGVGIVGCNIWAMWKAVIHLGFGSIGMGAATVTLIAILGAISLVFAMVIALEARNVLCKSCLAVSLWTRGYTPVSMEWFGDAAGATWGFGAKNIYIWQKPFHGWGNPELRVRPYQDVAMMGPMSVSDKFLVLSMDIDLPPPSTEWLRFPESSNGMTGAQIAASIVERAALAGRSIELREPKPGSDEGGKTTDTKDNQLIQIVPPASCWKLLF
ncbi:hypothetical protein G6L37_00325 [Agrobacterium rubi]|nr:hypothetical protein [Agrobacterium rubi]NTF23834.1 hypothetical protein [Agrobacterium rubi]